MSTPGSVSTVRKNAPPLAITWLPATPWMAGPSPDGGSAAKVSTPAAAPAWTAATTAATAVSGPTVTTNASVAESSAATLASESSTR